MTVTPNMVDYQETYRDFRLDVPDHFNFGFDVVDRWAADRTKLALISVSPTGEHAEKHTFWDIMVLSNRFANLLSGLGVSKGDRAFILAPRIPEWYTAMIGMMKLGVVPMPATTLCTSLRHRVQGHPLGGPRSPSQMWTTPTSWRRWWPGVHL